MRLATFAIENYRKKIVEMKATTLLIIAIALTVLVYLPGMSGGFVFDDYPNILFNDNLTAAKLDLDSLSDAGWSGKAGPLKRPLSMVSFALNIATTGIMPFAFKLTNLIIHLLNGVLLFVFLRLIGAAYFKDNKTNVAPAILAAVATAIWLVHPINLTSVLYIVQRMNSLAVGFSLLAMICYCTGRVRLVSNRPSGWWFIAGGVPIAVSLGVLCKENAVLVVPLLILVETCFYRLETSNRRDRNILIGLGLASTVPVAVLIAAYLLQNPELFATQYAKRPFSLIERLLTEARVLWFYLSLIVLPRLSRFGLYHDDIALSSDFFEPMTTLPALLGIVAAIAIGLLSVRRNPLITFAVFWFLIGHSIESSVIPLEITYEHRNYLPAIGVIWAAVTGLSCVFAEKLSARFTVLIAFLFIAVIGSVSLMRAADWSDPITLATMEAQRHPHSFRAIQELGRINFERFRMTGEEQYYDSALKNLERAATLDLKAKTPLAGILKIEYSRGRTPDPRHLAELLRRYRHELFHGSETLDLHVVAKCHAGDECLFPQQVVIDMFHAALSNPTLPDYSKGQLMVDLAVFYVNEAADFSPALALAEEAVALNPREFGFRKVRAEIGIYAGKYDLAEQQIRYMRSVSRWTDELRPPLEKINGLEALLKKVRESRVSKSPERREVETGQPSS